MKIKGKKVFTKTEIEASSIGQTEIDTEQNA